jgi:lipopolysaccharide export LptBFGC system permease protein LptF
MNHLTNKKKARGLSHLSYSCPQYRNERGSLHHLFNSILYAKSKIKVNKKGEINMKELLIKIAGWTSCCVILTVIATFQLLVKESVPTGVKVGVPLLIAGIVIFFIGYGYFKKFVNRRLQSIDTARQLGHTVSPIYSIIADLEITIPVLMFAGLFLTVGIYARNVGLILLECSGALQIGFVSNIVARFVRNGDIKQAEVDKITANNQAVAEEVAKIMGVE